MSQRIDVNHPPYAEASGVRRLLYETIDHLWPWGRQGWHQHKAIQLAGLVLAVAVTISWGLAASGRLGSRAMIGWWLSWSIYEIIIRLQCKPYIKEGPWWRHHYRSAGLMDMICYVTFKNLLIGATLFMVLRYLGLLQILN